ncbi:MAG: hypothetical protein OZ922_11765 [Myxococcales bacterium]|jgi:hypothetical protein|nr:hypothetical protein [Myxococcales bacterium]
MSGLPVLRIIAAVLLGLALGSLPFWRYAARWHRHHEPPGTHVHHP